MGVLPRPAFSASAPGGPVWGIPGSTALIPRDNQWYTTPTGGVQTQTGALSGFSQPKFLPWIPNASFTIDQVGLRVLTGQAGSNCRLALYDSTTGIYPKPNQVLGQVLLSCTTNATWPTAALPSAVPVVAGEIYFWAYANDTNTTNPTLYQIDTDALTPLLQTSDFGPTAHGIGFFVGGASLRSEGQAFMDDPFSTWTFFTGGGTLSSTFTQVRFRVAA